LKRIKRLVKKLNNRGSSLIMVIVSIGFVAIIVGALLSAAGYAYRLKLVNKNAKDNFYYVEQAMQEIYAGVGSKTVEQMYDAYTSTIENMVYYDLGKDSYATLSNTEANIMFKSQFMTNIKNEEYFKQGDKDLAASLENFISNDTVKIDRDAFYKDSSDPDKLCLKNITLTRTVEYSNNYGSGTYTQTVSADIEICQPDFDVKFDSTSADYSTIFDYAMVADMGVEIDQGVSNILKITGNIYAAADYYNKTYDSDISDDDEYVNVADSTETSSSRTFTYKYDEDGSISYTHGSVSSKVYNDLTIGPDGLSTGLYNKYAEKDGAKLLFDGENTNSAYSGLYINNSNVSLQADMLIVPGTIAVMNDSDLSVYSRSNGSLSKTEVWADNIVLGGYGEKVDAESTQTTYLAPEAYFNANLYVRDDTELNAERSDFTLKGAYFGYGNSTEKDTRVFVPTVNTEDFQIAVAETNEDGTEKKDSNGNTIYKYVNRDHYNSSAIVINGQNTTLDLSGATALYLAGRAYIELSKNVTYNAEDGTDSTDNVKDGSVYVDADGKLTDTAASNTEVVTETYSYNPGTRDEDGNIETYISDYKTGESLSLKSTQLAYIPIILNGVPAPYTLSGESYTCVKLHPSVAGVGFFKTFFPTTVFTDGYVPVISQTVSNRTYYYYDLDTAYALLKAADATTYKSADEYSAAFIEAYVEESNNPTDEENPLPLNDILANDDFSAGNVVINATGVTSTGTSTSATGTTTSVYSSGAITTKIGEVFNIILQNSDTDLETLLASASTNNTIDFVDSSTAVDALSFSKDISTEYTYIKWNLGHFSDSEANEQAYVDKLLANGWTEDMLTPINRYMLFENISDEDNKAITPASLKSKDEELPSGYKIWVTKDDVVIGADEADYYSDSTVKGVVITKGDVSFDSNVTRFEGLIISGGKIYINGNLQTMTASPEICRSIMRDCMVVNSETTRYIRNVFAQYQIKDGGACPLCGKELEVIENTDDEGNVISTTSRCNNEDCSYNDSVDIENSLLVDVDKLDYSDVCSIDNWVKSVE
jgi:hypothetical protein